MQGTEISENLSAAINYLEELLNNKDGDTVIQNIKKYKKTRNPKALEVPHKYQGACPGKMPRSS